MPHHGLNYSWEEPEQESSPQSFPGLFDDNTDFAQYGSTNPARLPESLDLLNDGAGPAECCLDPAEDPGFEFTASGAPLLFPLPPKPSEDPIPCGSLSSSGSPLSSDDENENKDQDRDRGRSGNGNGNGDRERDKIK